MGEVVLKRKRCGSPDCTICAREELFALRALRDAVGKYIEDHGGIVSSYLFDAYQKCEATNDGK